MRRPLARQSSTRDLRARVLVAVLENFNEHFKAIFEVHGQVPTKGRINTERFALEAVLVYQLALLYRHERNLDINRGLKPFLRAA